MSETRKHRSFTPEQKIEIVLAGLRGDRPVWDVCRFYEISEAPDAPNGKPSTRPGSRSPTYIQHYHHRPHSGIDYRTPTEVAAIWRREPETQMNPAT